MSDSIPLVDLSKRTGYYKMPTPPAPFASKLRDRSWTASLIGSYVFDWIVLAIVVGIGAYLGIIEPNKRPFSVLDPSISFPFTENETVPIWPTLVIAIGIVPLVVIAVVCLVFVPGNTVPRGTPRDLTWKRKLWELHTGVLGFSLAMAGAWFITNGMKNMFGKPRPDLISRCIPDLTNIEKYIIGGASSNVTSMSGPAGLGQLVSADICTQTDSEKLNDGFRSYPSGHASAAAASLIYLSLFMASKFAVTIPYVPPSGDAASHTAFPSRIWNAASSGAGLDGEGPAQRTARYNKLVTSIRRQAAAPPLYLLTLVVIPFLGSIFITGSRWFDFRHHGFDLLFGYFIGFVTSFFAFRYYHLPIRQGAGWAWGPRSHDKAWWSGVGSYSYATDKCDYLWPGDEEEARRVRTSD
ncbi:hypothetical protein FOYG_17010 [Fusarium oxysporum NRRL 32931]|uniref:Phosphatidic acid phosphatase type 2/haloperoxidase domain-containing protein n=1 Tax=Fusarium oxysporum NRRL 32931 TaxID=660029 RepID=W9HB95_FUSOX|nr:hypothetical protein FOYG_17010 [Fusarium oxysporum NRRL 32931]